MTAGVRDTPMLASLSAGMSCAPPLQLAFGPCRHVLCTTPLLTFVAPFIALAIASVDFRVCRAQAWKDSHGKACIGAPQASMVSSSCKGLWGRAPQGARISIGDSRQSKPPTQRCCSHRVSRHSQGPGLYRAP